MSQKSSPYKIAVEDCPHENLGPWEPWAMMGLTIATCKDCGNTIAQEDGTDTQDEGDPG